MNVKALWDKFTDSLIDDWKQAWKFLSVQLTAVYTVIAGYAAAEPAEFAKFLEMLPPEVKVVVVFILAVAPIYARLKKQKSLS